MKAPDTHAELVNALREMLSVYCEDGGTTPEACQEAERQAREALAEAEGGEE